MGLEDLREGYSRTALPIIGWFNRFLTSILGNKAELVIIAIAIAISYKLKTRKYIRGGWNYWFKVSFVVYIILKILGFGINPLDLLNF